MNGRSDATPPSRRAFLGLAAGGAVAAGGWLAWERLVRERVDDAVAPPGTVPGTAVPGTTAPSDPADSRVLVVVQLGGGNDALDTLVPTAGAYRDLRPTLAVPEADVAELPGAAAYGLHPSLKPLAPRWRAGTLAAAAGIGLPEQSRSHFQAMDTWWTAATEERPPTGWLGRWLDRTADPSDPLKAVSLGGGAPALVGARARSTVVLHPEAFRLQVRPGAEAETIAEAFAAFAEPLATDPTTAAAQQAYATALRAVDVLAAAQPEEGSPNGEQGLRLHGVGDLLDTAAGILGLGLGTRIVHVGVSGYDTHANQAQVHPELLDDLATGVDRFLRKVDEMGRGDDVLVMTVSEFGRRAAENGSGTDHGRAGVSLVAGKPVGQAQVAGELALGSLEDGDLPIVIDTRSLYAEALDWLDGEAASAQTDDVLGGPFERLGLVGP